MMNYRPTYSDRAFFAEESERPGLWQGLVGLWAPMLGPTGLTLRDQSGRHNNGVLTNMDPASDWAPSPHGWALDFDGSDDFVALPNFYVPRLTVFAWVKSDVTTGNRTILSNHNGSTLDWQLFLSTAPNPDAYRLRIDTTGGFDVLDASTGGSNYDKWHSITATYDETTMRIYFNGKLDISKVHATGGAIKNTGNAFQLGALDGALEWNGLMGLVGVWNRDLTPAEIADLHADPFAMLRLRRLIVAEGEIITAASPVSAAWSVAAPGLTERVKPSAVSASWSVIAPDLKETVKPSSISAAWSVVVPGLKETERPSPVSASWSVIAPSLKETTKPSAVSAAWSVVKPNRVLQPQPVSAAWSATIPDLKETVKPSVLSATWSVIAPTLEETVKPSPLSATWSVPASSLRETVKPSAVAAAWSAVAPGLRKTTKPSATSAAWSVIEPTAAGLTILPAGLLQSGHYHLGV